jgi:hypothetical protein
MGDFGKNIGKMLNAEASHDRAVESHADQTEDNDTIAGLLGVESSCFHVLKYSSTYTSMQYERNYFGVMYFTYICISVLVSCIALTRCIFCPTVHFPIFFYMVNC